MLEKEWFGVITARCHPSSSEARQSLGSIEDCAENQKVNMEIASPQSNSCSLLLHCTWHAYEKKEQGFGHMKMATILILFLIPGGQNCKDAILFE